MKYAYLLPIGTIVKLKDREQPLMICGVLQKAAANPETLFDYVAVPYPEGIHDVVLNIGFNHSDIQEVIFKGYEDDNRKAFIVILEILEKAMDIKKEADSK